MHGVPAEVTAELADPLARGSKTSFQIFAHPGILAAASLRSTLKRRALPHLRRGADPRRPVNCRKSSVHASRVRPRYPAKPRRLPSTRRAVADTRLAEINQVAATTGDDPELDTLILRLHTETACRRGGALALRPADLDRDSAWSCSGKRARRSAGSRSPPP